MQITFFFLLFASPLFAANLCDQDKDPLINQCYLDACTAQTNKVKLPATDKAFEKEVSTAKITRTATEQEAFDREAAKVTAALKRSADFVKERGAEKIAEEILQKPIENMKGLDALLKDKFSVTRSANGEYVAITSDLEDEAEKSITKNISSYYLEILNTQKDYADFAYDKSDLNKQNNFLVKITKELAQVYDSTNKPKANELRAISQKIASDKSKYYGVLEMNKYFTYTDLNALFSSKSAAVKKDIAHVIVKRLEDRQKRPPYKDVLQRSCQVASYMISKVKDRDLAKEYEKAKQNAVKGLNEKFLKNACPEISQFLKQSIQGDVFNTIELNKNYLPDFKTYEKEIASIAQMNDTKAFLKYLEFSEENSKNLICDVSIFTPTDMFQGQVNTSMFTLAMGYSNVVSHELGHWVSSMLNSAKLGEACSGKFKNLRACISSFYEEKGADMYQLYPGDSQRTEEDFADWFSAITSNDKSNFDCDIGKITDLVYGFMGYNSDAKPNIYLPNSNDSHSGSLFRVLHAKIVRKEPLTPNCEKLLKKYPESSPKKCNF